MAKQILFNVLARTLLKNGVDKIANAVKITIGPKGRNVVIQDRNDNPLITNDGVTIAKEITLENPYENLGASLIKEVAEKTQYNAGDGTTTAAILMQSIIELGMKHITAGVNPMFLKRGLLKYCKIVVLQIQQYKKDLNTSEEIAQIAAISSNNDVEIGTLIAQAMLSIGKEGVINIEEAKSMETSLEKVDGIQFNKGYISPYFITNQGKMTVLFDNAYILFSDKKITAMKDLLPILQSVAQTDRALLIIADEVEGLALGTLVVNRLRGNLQICAVRAPLYGSQRRAMLEDMAIMTGGMVVADDTGKRLEDLTIEDLGQCKKVIVDRDSTTLREGAGNPETILKRVTTIKMLLHALKVDWNIEKLNQRLAKMNDGVAIIKIGAATETEMKEKKARVDDALHATRAAVLEGIIPGGGVVYIHATKALENIQHETHELRVAAEILIKALQKPAYQIAFNAGMSGDVVVLKIKGFTNPNMGYNAATDKYEDLILSGVIDPAKVARCAVQNAVSIAALFLTTECIITTIKDDKKDDKHHRHEEDMY